MGSFPPYFGGRGTSHKGGVGEALAPKPHHLQGSVRSGPSRLSEWTEDSSTWGDGGQSCCPLSSPWFSFLLHSLLLQMGLAWIYAFRGSVCASDYPFHYLLVIVLSSLIFCSPVMSVQSVLLSSDMSYMPFEP